MDATLMSQHTAYVVIVIYALVMIGVVWLTTSAGKHIKERYFVADRRVGILPAAASIAVSWIWAPAIFFAGMKSYADGMAGAFWFIVPNILCFLTFAFVVRKMRTQFPDFYTMPDYVLKRFSGEKNAHLASLLVAVIIGIVALLFNSFVGAFLLKMLTGIEIFQGIGIMLLIAVAYSVWRGFPASIATDFVQMLAIAVIAGALVPWVLFASSGTVSLTAGLGGADGHITSIFDRNVVYSFGIPATLALLTVPLADQMFYHRAVAVPRNKIIITFVVGGLLFGIIPILLSIPGFIGAALEAKGRLVYTGLPPLFVTVDVIAQFLPVWCLSTFVVLAICALSSTIDSTLVGLALIWSQDIYSRYIKPQASERQIIKQGRLLTIVIAFIAYGLVWLLRDYLSGDVLFNFNGAIASTIAGPLLLSVFFRRTTSFALTASVLAGLAIAVPGALWANHGYHVLGDKEMARYVLAIAGGVPLLTTALTLLLTCLRPSATPARTE